jgi:hypothetical protein
MNLLDILSSFFEIKIELDFNVKINTLILIGYDERRLICKKLLRDEAIIKILN